MAMQDCLKPSLDDLGLDLESIYLVVQRYPKIPCPDKCSPVAELAELSWEAFLVDILMIAAAHVHSYPRLLNYIHRRIWNHNQCQHHQIRCRSLQVHSRSYPAHDLYEENMFALVVAAFAFPLPLSGQMR